MAKQNAKQFSLLCWNIKADKLYDKEKVEYLCEQKTDLYFLQEVLTDTLKNFLSLLPKEQYQAFYIREKDGLSCNCIIYKKDYFEVYKASVEKFGELQCALDDNKKWPDPWPDDEKYKPFKSLSEFDRNYTDKRVCVAVLQVRNTQETDQHKFIVASCHVPSKSGSTRARYAKCMLKEIKKQGKELGYPIIVAGDFNCDLIQKGGYLYGFIVPKYDPTIHRVICSGGNGTPCIDFFTFKNCGAEGVVAKVDSVRAKMVCDASTVLNSNKSNFLQYQDRLREISTLDYIHKVSDHDPLTATLTIEKNETLPIMTNKFKILYFDLDMTESDMIVKSLFAGLHPKPDLCIFQNVNNGSYIKEVYKSLRVFECKPICFIAYDVSKFSSKGPTSKTHTITCTFQCERIEGKPSFTLAICDPNCGKVKDRERDIQAGKYFEEVIDDSPVLLVGKFYVDLFKHKNIPEKYSFKVPNYEPTMYRMTHPYVRSSRVIVCRDFFTFKNCTRGDKASIEVEDVCADTIIPPRRLITEEYTVSYDLIMDKSKSDLLETLSATVTIRNPIPASPAPIDPSCESTISESVAKYPDSNHEDSESENDDGSSNEEDTI